ncbi:MAG: hypothetical protein HC836_31935 [Richelia sp. RM2_1_2]|uniref:Uncharacterized protein n=1 Tax=Plectonema cf. radiosum LEGE 06105 TaxID=945769 RepID=A0A8J7K3X4_9CYAN|nr:hypothetical protein [Plectonema radiosum]MBE9215692.1 hypothetical protein [Plectonema cf. radiosum LEGE 06105]NJN13883.1 hypothetical protein [Richelia sp. RM1_1_1]NJO62676.1 hypothetical protein [Richelia sp. RM2_1_2]
MKIKDILQLLKALLLISEQVTDMIADTSIPKNQQPEIQKEVDLALSRLQSAKSKIEIDPNNG